MALTDYVIMPGADYQATCDKLREITGTTNLIKSGDLVSAVDYTSGATALATDIAFDKTSFVNGKKVTGTLGEVTSGVKIFASGDCTLYSSAGATEIAIGGVYRQDKIGDNTLGCILRPGAILIPRYIPTSLFGNATADQVMKGATFTSAAGLLIEGTHECEAGVELPTLTNPGSASDLVEGAELIDQSGAVVKGTIPKKTSSNLTASGATVNVPAGYYAEPASKTIADGSVDISISVDNNGKISAIAPKTAGYIQGGSVSTAKQLPTQAAQTITPGTQDQTIASGKYLTGAQTILGDANLVAENIKNGISIFGITGSMENSLPENISNVYVWEKYSVNNDLYIETENSYCILASSAVLGDQTISYADEISVVDGVISLANPQKLTIPEDDWSNTDLYSPVLGKYVDMGYNGIYFLPSNAELSTELSGTMLYVSTHDAVAIELNDFVPEFLCYTGSDARDTYPDDEVVGEYKYVYLGVLNELLNPTLTITKSGTTTSNVIKTGLSTIDHISIYKTSVDATGFVQGTYTSSNGKTSYTYCSSYSSWSKQYAVAEDTNGTVDGGTFTWGGTSTAALSSGVTYKWVAAGNE